jgi:hypothetical protein
LAIRLRRIYGGFAAVRRASPAAKRAFCHGIVKNQQGSATVVWKCSISAASVKFSLPDFSHSRDNSRGGNFSRAAPGGELRSPDPASRGYAAFGGLPGAFHTGMVKNQQGFATEALKIIISVKSALLNFPHSRDNSSGENFSRSARLAIRLRRIYGGFAAVRRASPAAKRAVCHGIVKNQQGFATELL